MKMSIPTGTNSIGNAINSPTGVRRKLNILIMPTDYCNMNCVYCFHKSYHCGQDRMTLETIRQLYDITFKRFSDVLIIWHGGEPLSMGMSFYEKAIEMQKHYKNVRIRNRMQSNLTLLNESMANFLCENKIGIGSSLDGVCNDILRGHTDTIISKRQLLKKSGMNCGFIMVLSSKNVDHLIESYCFFKAMHASFTINPYISSSKDGDDRLRLDIDHASKKLIELFDYWLFDTTCMIHIDYFERFIRFLVSGVKSVCKYKSCLGKWIGIRYNGDIMPCNRYFPEEYCFGNVYQYNDISEAFSSDGFSRILSESIKRREKCQECSIYAFCEGGCNNVAYNENGICNNGGDSCILTQNMYKYIHQRIQDIMADRSLHQINPYVDMLLQKNRLPKK